MYTIDIVMEALSLYNNNKSFRMTSKLLQTKYNYKITRQSIMNWYKWMNNDLDKICKKRMTMTYCVIILFYLNKNHLYSIQTYFVPIYWYKNKINRV